ncbi:L,D-transpeptidase [Actinopolymorpha pittospori]|uniref:Lipoprotein-anchoring transpeptidase ErfK/SrfK n=1 Tax=Actinopolymorpha pittospori TaxID=648752 RepID=A0A927N4V9_9ACTN|nr:L,D-transpeptidase [Actinopolymorpha pittospori]MBE1611767.1 lipoprotein-anchoring transpeptidase ErfK/SrfK [Actinopolymorpha pittospori]
MRHVASRSRPRPRLRRGRLIAAGLSVLVLAVAVLGAVGIIPVQDASIVTSAGADDIGSRASRDIADRSRRESPEATQQAADPKPSSTSATPKTPPTPSVGAMVGAEMPTGTGKGKRVVYALRDNHVWLVDAKNIVKRSYPVSGTKFNQVSPGSYDVIRKRRYTTSYHGTERMQYMVTFTFGKNAAIGFHDIPISIASGKPVQTPAQLGQSLSDGCVRQAPVDAKALWEFAPPGTPVIVLA